MYDVYIRKLAQVIARLEIILTKIYIFGRRIGNYFEMRNLKF